MNQAVDHGIVGFRVNEDGFPRWQIEAAGAVAYAGGEAEPGVERRIEGFLAFFEKMADFGGVALEFAGWQLSRFGAGENLLLVAPLGKNPPDNAGAAGA